MKVADNVLAVLSVAEVSGAGVRLTGQLDRKLYERVDLVLKAAGGRWDRKARLHLFEGLDPVSVLDDLLLTSEVVDARREFGFFETPLPLVRIVHGAAALSRGVSVLEPSAGRGALVEGLRPTHHAVSCVEIQEHLAADLEVRLPRATVLCTDFLSVMPTDFLSVLPSWVGAGVDRVLMNPPFARQADVRHVNHALRFLKPSRSSLLVAIMSAGVTFRQDALARSFRDLVAARGGEVDPLPDDSFRPAGTSVRTVLVTIPGEGSS